MIFLPFEQHLFLKCWKVSNLSHSPTAIFVSNWLQGIPAKVIAGHMYVFIKEYLHFNIGFLGLGKFHQTKA